VHPALASAAQHGDPAFAGLPGLAAPVSLALSPLAGPVGCLMLAYACWLFWRSQHDVLLGNAAQAMAGRGLSAYSPSAVCGLVAGGAGPVPAGAGWLGGSGGVPAVQLWAQCKAEEGLLLQWLGDAYRQYMQHTGRLWPRGLAR
jgi:protein-S-isoprenylcysteine O-methyltransferase Ste14